MHSTWTTRVVFMMGGLLLMGSAGVALERTSTRASAGLSAGQSRVSAKVQRPAPATAPFTTAITGFSSARTARMFGW